MNDIAFSKTLTGHNDIVLGKLLPKAVQFTDQYILNLVSQNTFSQTSKLSSSARVLTPSNPDQFFTD